MRTDDRPVILTASMARLLLQVLSHSPASALPHPLESAQDMDVTDALSAISEGLTLVVYPQDEKRAHIRLPDGHPFISTSMRCMSVADALAEELDKPLFVGVGQREREPS